MNALEHVRRGDQCLSSRDYDQAIAEYSEAIEIDSRYGLAYAKRALAYWQKGKRVQETFFGSLATTLGSAQPWRAAGLVGKEEEFIGYFQHAYDDFEKALELDPTNATTYYNRGLLYTQEFKRTRLQHFFDRALADLGQAIKLNRSFAQAYYNRGYLYSVAQDDPRAISDFGEAIRLAPNDTQSLAARGLLHAARGDFDRALADLDRVVLLNPGDARWYLCRGQVRQDKGARGLAISDFKKALELSRDDSVRQEAEAGLRALGG